MFLKNAPIQRKLMTVILLTSGSVLLVTSTAFFAYEFLTFRQTTLRQLSTLAEIIGTNSTAALAFDDKANAGEILEALKAEKHIVAACLYDKEGKLFSFYPLNIPLHDFPTHPDINGGYRFKDSHLIGFQPIFLQGNKLVGTLYLKSDMEAMYERFQLYGIIAVLVAMVSFLVAYLMSNAMQQRISKPILALAKTAKSISDHSDYSVRAIKLDNDELGSLTDAFNHMLTQIQGQNLEILSFNQRLEQLIAERTKELEVSNKELEAFSYSVSHDLRAPLRSINAYMNIFLEDYGDGFDEEAKHLTKKVLDNSKKMGQLIDDLLEFSKLGRRELRKTNVSMDDMVSEIWEDLRRMEADRPIELIMEELPIVQADYVTMRQVWVNLISNALKYSKHKENPIIQIDWKEREDTIVFSVKDNGAGFDMKYYSKLFGVFQRLHSQEEFEGTGVGLAIVQRVVAKHGGSVWAEGKINEGAEFYFSISKS